MNGADILVVDDDETTLKLVEKHLAEANFNVTSVGTGEEAISVARAKFPDLILLDIALPGVDGLELASQLKEDIKTQQIPICLLSGKSKDEDVIAGFNAGADDYVGKPFNPEVLLCRIKSLLKRQASNEKQAAGPGLVIVDDLEIDYNNSTVKINGEGIDLSPTEFSLLDFFLNHSGQVNTPYKIAQALNEDDYPITPRSIIRLIESLQKKLGHCGKYIEIIVGIGYRFRYYRL